ncbi:MAG: hemerythrin family protein [Magnetococcales bacterium]|nr:hemerythrin family protein [Magnetococcales bacterium]
METLLWNESLSVGCTEIDNDHKKLVGLLNNLIVAVSENRGRDVVGKVLNDLLSYTAWHFRHEERLMQTYRYEGIIAHKNEHAELIGHADSLRRQFQEKEVDITQEVIDFLKQWLTHHILETDLHMGRFLEQKMGAGGKG